MTICLTGPRSRNVPALGGQGGGLAAVGAVARALDVERVVEGAARGRDALLADDPQIVLEVDLLVDHLGVVLPGGADVEPRGQLHGMGRDLVLVEDIA